MELGNLIQARFVQRLNRFVCKVDVNGSVDKVLIRNTGRLEELLVEGREVYLRRKDKGKYRYEMVLVRAERSLVCVDSHMAPYLLLDHMRAENYPWPLKSVRLEPKVGRSRFDILVNDNILVETKSVNLVKGSKALFPDAPTERGRRHIRDLIGLSGRYTPAVVFVIQREDAEVFSPNYDTDPEFGRALEEFHRMGFTVKAFLCKVSLYEVRIWKEVPVVLNMS